MRKFLLASIFTAFAMPAFATDSGDAAFELLSKFTAEAQETNYIKLQSTIAMSDAMAIDARISELYGVPEVSRGGLKVWEIKNDSSGADQAKFTTIMCGPDQKGGIYISADRRHPRTSQTVPQPDKNAKNQKFKEKSKARGRARAVQARPDRSALTD